MWNKERLEKALENNLIKLNIDSSLITQEVIIDSRSKTNNGLFIAIKGDINDGHNYLEQVFENGAILAIVQEIPTGFENDKRLILVKDSNQTLVDLAKYSRSIFKGKVIGLTGSVGKTSIKEMLKTILSTHHNVFANFGNLNNHIGLPLSLCNLEEDQDYAILEMGMNHLGEIDFLTKIAKPDIAIISNITAAHIGNFKNEEEIALAKSEIFNGLNQNGFAVLNHDNKYYDFLREKALSNNIKESNIISFGDNENSDVNLESFQILNNSTSQINIKVDKKNISYQINNVNETLAKNSLIVIAVLKILQRNINDYLNIFNDLETPEGRGNIINIGKIKIIDDSYNANLASVISGLKFLKNLKQENSRTIAIIGDMLELGDNAKSEHKAIATYINDLDIDKVLLVGELTKNIIPDISKEKLIGHFDTSKDLASKISDLIKDNDILFIKGSRGTKMELIINSIKNVT